MALAWNAGWVNSPQGFKSPILRTRSGVRPAGTDGSVAPSGPSDSRRSMGRSVAVIWHASFSIAAGVLYFFFVLPRWLELSGESRTTLGTALRIVAGALIGLAALPVVFTLLHTRRPEFGTPQLALTLRRRRSCCTCSPVCSSSARRSARSGSAWIAPGNGCSASTARPPRSRCSACWPSTWRSWPNCRRRPRSR